MSPVLDATKIQDESELTQELRIHEEEAEATLADAGLPVISEEQLEQLKQADIDPVRSITLDPPSDCGTAIVLLVQHGGDDFYRCGFRVMRDYKTSPHEQSGEDLPPTDPAADEGFRLLGEAAAAAAEMAAEWLQFHSDDNDERTQAALTFLDEWIGELDPVSVAESIFDDTPIAMPETVGEAIALREAVETEQAKRATDSASAPGVTDEAQRHYDDRKHELEERLGTLSIEQVRLKAAVKCNREAMNTVTEELESHLERGPERLPLFDRAKPVESTASATPVFDALVDDATGGDPEKKEQLQQAIGELVASAPESWRAATVEELGLDPKLCTLLREQNNIATLGQIADWCESYALTDLKKVGPAKATKIEEAMDDYWAKHPQAEVAEAKTSDDAKEEREEATT